MRLENYLADREDNIANFADAFESLIRTTQDYDKATDEEADKPCEKTEKASQLAYNDRKEAAKDVVYMIERIVGVKRYVVEESE
jgi:hypothetical protein